MMKGLPASGKSTWAKEFVKGKKDWIRVNNDELGLMMFGELFAEGRSDDIDRARKQLITLAMSRLDNIVVDCTNLHPKHEEYLKDLVFKHNESVIYTPKPELYSFEIKDFTDVPVEECIKRNKKRDNPVPDKIIYQMYRSYIAKEHQYVEQDPTLPKALIVDLDGTMADCSHRNPYDAKKCGDDAPIDFVIEIVKRFQSDHHIIFVSGRDAKYMKETIDWLTNKAGLKAGLYSLYMKPDKAADLGFKQEIFDAHIKNKYYVTFVLEDRTHMVQMYRHKLKLPCLQVADGDF